MDKHHHLRVISAVPLAPSGGAVRAPDPNGAPPIPHAARRGLLGGFASMLLLIPSEAGASKAAELDGELIAACAEFGRLEDAYDVTCRAEDRTPDGPEKEALDAQLDVLGDQQLQLYAMLCGMPARTPEGLRAKAEAVLCWLQKAPDGTPCNHGDQLTWSLVRDLLGRA